MSDDYGTEAEALSDWDDFSDWDDEDEDHFSPSPRRRRTPRSHYQGGDRDQTGRWRCLSTGCNPVLDEATAQAHKAETGHRVAKWPIRSSEGKRRARERNRSGYYDRYNVGHKSAWARGIR